VAEGLAAREGIPVAGRCAEGGQLTSRARPSPHAGRVRAFMCRCVLVAVPTLAGEPRPADRARSGGTPPSA
jgi:hypothetical protein